MALPISLSLLPRLPWPRVFLSAAIGAVAATLIASVLPSEQYSLAAAAMPALMGGLLGGVFCFAYLITRAAQLVLEKRLSEKDAALEELRLSEERLAFAMKAAADGLWDWDINENKVYFSPSWAHMFGLDPETIEPRARTWSNLLRPEQKDRVLGQIQLCIRDGVEVLEHEYEMRHASGEWMRVLSRAYIQYDQNGRAVRASGIVYDVASRAALKRQIEIAEEQNRAKSAFLANMSHEIRTPMNGVVGMVDLLKRTELRDDQQQMLETIQNSSHSLLRIIDDILDLSKIEAGKMTLEVEQTDLLKVVESVLDILTPTAQASNVRLLLVVECELPRAVSTDAGRLRQVLLNLVGNAVKFTAQKPGTEQKLVELKVLPGQGREVRFQVIDNGIGIDDEAQKRLFEPFYQAGDVNARSVAGTGLGLAISFDLLRMMGGNMTVESTLGQGSTFTVNLPLDVSNTTGGTLLGMMPSREDYSFSALSDDIAFRSRFPHFISRWADYMPVFDNREKLLSWAEQQSKPVFLILAMVDPGQTTHILQELQKVSPHSKCLGFTDRPSDKLGRQGPDLYVVRRSPLLPSRMVRGMSELLNEAPDLVTEPENHSISTPQGTVLLVEDNPINQDVLMRQLALLGYGAEAAGDGEEGLRLWQSGSFDIILTDCQMPVMDGMEMTKEIRNIEMAQGLAPVPIIGISANALKGEGARCMDAGMNAYLTKPATLDQLRACLSSWIVRRQSA